MRIEIESQHEAYTYVGVKLKLIDALLHPFSSLSPPRTAAEIDTCAFSRLNVGHFPKSACSFPKFAGEKKMASHGWLAS
jgi:hypothetical protein